MDGTSKEDVFFRKIRDIKCTPVKKKIEHIASEELSIIEKIRKEYGELNFYTNKLMSGPLTTICEKVFESFPFKRKVKKKPNPIKIKPKATTAEIITRCEILREKMSYKQVTQNIYLDILPTVHHEELIAKIIFFNFVVNFNFFSNDLF